MKKSILGNADLEVSQIALGTHRFGSVIDVETSYKIMDYYISRGGNIIDTARSYGVSEPTIGKYLKLRNNKNKLIISTKGANPTFNPYVCRLSKKDIEYDINKSLSELNVDCVDIFWLHRDDENVPVCEVIGILDDIIKSGKARYIGASNWSINRIIEANNCGKNKFIASQIQYSYVCINKEHYGDETMVMMDNCSAEAYKNAQIPVFAYSPLASGLFNKIAHMPKNEQIKYFDNDNMKLFDQMLKCGEDKLNGNLIKGLSENSSIQTVPIFGCSKISQLENVINLL